MKSFSPSHYIFAIGFALLSGVAVASLFWYATTFAVERIVSNESGNQISENEQSDENENTLRRGISATVIDQGMLEQIHKSLPHTFTSNVNAKSYIVAELGGRTLSAQNSARVLPIASVTKIVTAYVALDLYEKTEKIKVTSDALAAYGTTGRLRAGESLLLNDLLHALLLESSNDPAEVNARSYGRKSFLARMNDAAKKMGATHTYFDDPSGLSPKNVSTAEDLANIASYIYSRKREIFDITKVKTYRSGRHIWNNPNVLLSLSNFIGGKNGFTDEAQKTGVALFSVKNGLFGEKKIAIVLLGTNEREQDISKLLRAVEENN